MCTYQIVTINFVIVLIHSYKTHARTQVKTRAIPYWRANIAKKLILFQQENGFRKLNIQCINEVELGRYHNFFDTWRYQNSVRYSILDTCAVSVDPI